MQIHRVEIPGLAHYSYVLGSKSQAVVIDPKRDIDSYLGYANEQGVRITHVLETHIHADYASGALELSKSTRAELWLSGHDQGEEFAYKFEHHAFHDGEVLHVGNIKIVALHTPGHTPEHLSFVIYDTERCNSVPVALFSGDFVFVGSLGRPDLLGEKAKQKLASALFDSVHQKLRNVQDGIDIYPAHGAGSLCGAGMSELKQTTLGYERACNPYFQLTECGSFVEKILASVPPFPDYYRRMKRLNSDGPPSILPIPGARIFEPQEMKDYLASTGAIVLDLRRPEAFGGAHIPGAFNIGEGPNLSMWAAWVLPYDLPIVLVGDESADIEEARRSLIRVGLDNIAGSLKDGMKAGIEVGFGQAHIPQISVEELAALPNRFILDVRSDAEWNSGHIQGAVHVFGGNLPKRTDEVPRNAPVNVICGSGYRSSVAASVLARAGYKSVFNVVGGMTAWNHRRLATVTENHLHAA